MEKRNPPPPYSTVQPSAPIVIGAAPIVYTMANFGPDPQNCQCQHCHATIKTTIQVESTSKTHLAALLLCLLFCWPCACLPYCMDSCQNKNHYCPNCGAFLGSYSN